MVFGLFGKKKATTVTLMAPMKGEVQPIESVPDPVFSQKMMGDGFSIMPQDGRVVAPVDGEVINMFPTGHAFGIRTAEGLEVLVHIGIDTVNLKGEGFKQLVKQGAKVKAGDTMLEVALDIVKGRAPSIATPVVVTNLEGRTLTVTAQGNVNAGDAVATVTL